MVQKINPYPALGYNRSPPYYVFSKDAILGSVRPFLQRSLPNIALIDSMFDSSFSCPNCYELNSALLLSNFDYVISFNPHTNSKSKIL